MEISLDHLVAIFSDRNLFPRRRTPPLIKALAVKTYIEGLSFRSVANILSELGFKASYEAVRDWFHSVGGLLSETIRCGRGFILGIGYSSLLAGFWSAFLVAWIIKTITLRVGGSKLYETMGIPTAAGIVAGSMIAVLIGGIIGVWKFFFPF
jgi:hypothetical protein